MLIYNFQKEFLGIDEEDLKALGFSNLQELRAESADFADMFVKTPGHVHNFVHVHWIDFVICSDYNEDSKAIIHANNKNYKCTLNISTAYLIDNPSEKAFLVNLSKLTELSAKENEQISQDIYDKPLPVSTTASNPIFNTPEFEADYNSQDTYADAPSEKLTTIDEYDKYLAPVAQTNEQTELKVIKNDFIQEPHTQKEELKDDTPIELEITAIDDDNYIYDPMVASNALGLPVDLIEEFLQDFIIQSKDFKDELYDSVATNNLSNVKIMSHKLKGVAANLRVEDAFDALTIINSSDDVHEIRANLTNFYQIISHLAGETPENISSETTEETSSTPHDETIAPLKVTPTVPIVDDEEFIISFKDDEINESTDILEETVEEVGNKVEPLEFQEEFQEVTQEIEQSYIDEPQEIEQKDIPGILFDTKLAAAEIGLDIESYNELLKDYVDENLMAVDSINKAVQEGDFQMWKKHALKLKGMSDNMRIDIFTQEIEDLSTTQDTAVAQKAIHDIATKAKQISIGEF